jgi:Na+/melibiose symporter-like transporter
MWFYLAGKIGKRNSWLMWSLTCAATHSLFGVVGTGDHTKAIIIAGINGIPIGAKFLADAILADVIDYEEFLTGPCDPLPPPHPRATLG